MHDCVEKEMLLSMHVCGEQETPRSTHECVEIPHCYQRINENVWKINENLTKSTKIKENLWTSMKICENL